MEKFNLHYLKPSGFIVICAVLALSLFAANKYLLAHWGISFSVFALIGGLFSLVNSYLWNVRPFSWMYDLVDFTGKYEGELIFELKDGNGKTVVDKLYHIKVIKQNGSDVVVRSWTRLPDGSISTNSVSVESSIVKDKDGLFSLYHNYSNKGNSKLGLSLHHGTEILTIIKKEGVKYLVGNYYTDRQPTQTKGTVELKYVSKNLTHEI
jgi:hypothetical protein